MRMLLLFMLFCGFVWIFKGFGLGGWMDGISGYNENGKCAENVVLYCL